MRRQPRAGFDDHITFCRRKGTTTSSPSSAMETLSSRAFTRTSAGERFKKPATLLTGMPRRSVSLRKNKSALRPLNVWVFLAYP